MSKQRQAGFAVLELVLIIVVVAGLATLGYVVKKRQDNKATPSISKSTIVPATTASAPAIQNTGDLIKASQTLDQANVDGGASDNAQLDAQLNGL